MQRIYLIVLLLSGCLLYRAPLGATAPNYEASRALGCQAAERAARMLDVQWVELRSIVLTNAGFARPGGLSSQGCLDGLARKTGVSLGSSTLLRLRSRFDAPLWLRSGQTPRDLLRPGVDPVEMLSGSSMEMES